MECNVGARESYVRLVLGVLLLFLGFYFRTWLAYLGAIVGVVLIVTAMTKRCPLSRALGINTCRNEPS